MVVSIKFCLITIFFTLSHVAIAMGAELRCYNGSFNSYTIFSLDNPEPFLNSTFYNADQKTVVYVFGFEGKANGPSVQRIIEAYLNKANICLLNWEEEASSGILGPLAYPTKAVLNAKLIGVKFGKTLIKLYKAGLKLSKVHLIGFSLGGHVVGYTGKEVQNNGNIVGRISGLDIAGILYDGLISFRGLSASDANFVDILHTNPGGMGTDESTGMVDIWINCGARLQPGCDGDGIGITSEQNLCSHDRSWMYAAEAIDNPTAFVARAAKDCEAWREGRGTNKTIYVGDNIDTGARGKYYLQTNPTSPYGRGDEGSQPSS